MISVFDTGKLKSLLNDFYKITNIRITVFDKDMQELLSCPEEITPFCKIIRSSKLGKSACIQCDQHACRKALTKKDIHLYQCHAGLTEAVVPLYSGNILIGYLLMGHVFSHRSFDEGWNIIKERCKNLPVDWNRLKQACKNSPLTSNEYMRSAAEIMHAIASYLILENIATIKEDELPHKIDAYINTHYHERITAMDLCHEFGIGKTQLYKISNQLYGCGISKHIRSIAIKNAKKLLSDKRNLKISEISTLCGFNDYNYFISVFSQEVGVPPGEYRKKLTRPESI